MIITKNGVELRNLEEQVQENARLIAEHYNRDRVLADFGLRVIGNVPTAADLPDPDTFEGEYGDAFVVGSAEPFNVYVWTRPDIGSGHPNDYWLNIGPIAIEGPQGPAGVGIKGDTGNSTRWYSGTAAPQIQVDDEGNMYLNTANGDVYISVANQSGGYTWSLQGNIRGIQGIQGKTGPAPIMGNDGSYITSKDPQTGVTNNVIPLADLIGPKGDTGDVGGFINIRGILANVDQLPTPASLNNLSVGYLVGSAQPYDLYIQVGETPADAQWTNTGGFNAATLVMVNGEAQNVWNADTKLDKNSTALRLYGTDATGNPFMYRYDSDVVGNALVRRTVDGQIRCADPHPNHKEDVVTVGFLKDNSIYWPNVGSGTIPLKDQNGYIVYQPFAIGANNYSIAQRDNYGNLKASKAPVLGSTSTSNTYDDTKVATMGNMFEHANFSTQIRRINKSSLTAYKTLSTYGIYEFYIPEGSYIHTGAYAVNGVTTNTKLVVTGGILKIVYTPEYMIVEGVDSDNYKYETYYIPSTDNSYGKYAVQHPTASKTLYVKVDLFPPDGKYTLYDIGTIPTYK